MSKNIENIDRYLKGVVLPKHVSYQHQQQLCRKVLEESERKQTMSVRVRSWKYAAVIALISTGIVTATVVGVKVYKYRYLDRTEDGRYIVLREDGRKSWIFSKKTADSPEQAVQTAEEMDILKQQGIKELVSIREIEVNGQLDSRLLGYEYTLSDGRTIRQFEDDLDTGSGTLTDEQQNEARGLLDEVLAGSMFVIEDGHRFFTTAEGYVIPISERIVHGRVFSITKVPFALSDGTQIGWSIGSLREGSRSADATSDSSSSNTEQIRNDLREIVELRQQDKRQLIGIDELVVNGELDRKVFMYQYQLSDGRTMDMREGAGGGNFILSKAQRQEWLRQRNVDSGEVISTYEEKVNNCLFVFKKQRFVLSDGAELIWSFGTLKNDQ